MRLCLLLGFFLVIAVAVNVHAEPGQSKSRSSESQVSSQNGNAGKPEDDEKLRKPSRKDVSKRSGAKETKSSAKGSKASKSADVVDSQSAKKRTSKAKDEKSHHRGKIMRKKSPKTKAIDQEATETPQTECPGECIKSEEECPSGDVQEGGCQDGFKCCGHEAAPIASERASCPSTSRCQNRDGVCQKPNKRCNGVVKSKRRFCGDACVCCIPAKPCKNKSKCDDKKGTCQAMTAACNGDLITEKGYCRKRKRCACCVPKSGKMLRDQHRRSPNVVLSGVT
ncbi:uncharacterized protein [Panulirus ornatus]|uniref:uncharacterized protein n=1 Tax=Panulirus ornatus TaxID=150431 RepID=UPI003A8C3B1E